jgi:hypothetical protein
MTDRWARRPNEDPIDFPVSWNFHRFYEVENNRPDPGPAYPINKPEIIINEMVKPVSSADYHKLQIYVMELQNRLNTHIDRSKRKKGEY